VSSFDRHTGKSKSPPRLNLTFAPRATPCLSATAVLCLPHSTPPPPPPLALPAMSFLPLAALPGSSAEELQPEEPQLQPATPPHYLPPQLPCLLPPPEGQLPILPQHPQPLPLLAMTNPQPFYPNIAYAFAAPMPPFPMPITSPLGLPPVLQGTQPIWSAMGAPPPALHRPVNLGKKRKYDTTGFARDPSRKSTNNPWWCTCGAGEQIGAGRRTHLGACPRQQWLAGNLGDPTLHLELVGLEAGTRKGKKARRVCPGVGGEKGWEVFT